MSKELLETIINQQDETILYQRAIHCLIHKLDRRIIPFTVLLEISRFGFQIAISLVQLTSFKDDLNLTKSENSWATALFYFAYFIFAIPSTIFLRSIGPTRYLCLNMISWGSIGIGMAFITNAHELMSIRFLFGAVAAGYYPGMIIYFSLWYRKREQIMRIAIFHAATAAAGVVGGLLVYGISKMDGIANLKEWQWIFLLEGIPIIPLAIITYILLGNIPDTVRWLNNSEKQMLTNLLRTDVNVPKCEMSPSNKISWRQMRYVFTDWHVYLYAIIAIGDLAVKKCLIVYLPSIIQDMGFTKDQVSLMIMPPYGLACLSSLLGGYVTKRRNEHGFHLAGFLSIGILGFILMLSLIDYGKAAMYVSVCIAFCGTFPALSVLLSWLTNNVGGHTKRAIAVGFVSAMGQIGGIILPQIYRNVDKPTAYREGHIIAIILLFIALIITLLLRFSLMRENHRRDHLSIDKYNREAAVIEACDRHPDIRYVL